VVRGVSTKREVRSSRENGSVQVLWGGPRNLIQTVNPRVMGEDHIKKQVFIGYIKKQKRHRLRKRNELKEERNVRLLILQNNAVPG